MSPNPEIVPSEAIRVACIRRLNRMIHVRRALGLWRNAEYLERFKKENFENGIPDAET